MRDILEALADGELTPREAEARLHGYVTEDSGRYDAARPDRRGVPEAVLAAGKTPAEAAELAATALETTGHALVTRADARTRRTVADRLEAVDGDRDVRVDDRGRLVEAHRSAPPSVDATVALVTAGTADRVPAREARATLRAMGPRVDLVEDVGVAALDRLLDVRSRIAAADAAVVAAGREGALPTVVAGLVDTPVIALPVGSGYGRGGDGEAALLGALQSCTVLSTVNVDAGFVAGAQAGLIARAVAAARGEPPR
ncbi:MAG: nickel pincer cofactor biosynthesis protein LarB [Halobacteriales archaeon]